MKKLSDKEIAAQKDQWWESRVKEEYIRLLNSPQALKVQEDHAEYRQTLWKNAITEAIYAEPTQKADDKVIRNSATVIFNRLLQTPESMRRHAAFENYLDAKKSEAAQIVSDGQMKAMDAIIEGLDRDWDAMTIAQKLTPVQKEELTKESERLIRQLRWVKIKAVFYGLGQWLKSWFKK